MSRVTIYLPDDVERELRAAARKAGKNFSAFVTELVTRRKKAARGKSWPRDFLATFGSWEGEFEGLRNSRVVSTPSPLEAERCR